MSVLSMQDTSISYIIIIDSPFGRFSNQSRGMIMEIIIKQSKLSLVQGDITKQDTEAIVNAANSRLMGGGGVDGAIHRAGGPVILEECKKIVGRQGRLPTGKAVITTGGNLLAKCVVHTVGPVWRGGTNNEDQLLASAYLESLRLAEKKNLRSLSFPSISTGAYGYPVVEAATLALNTVVSFLKREDSSIEEVIFVLFDTRTYEAYAKALQEVLNLE
jgi:O-acetyl-ADP-ribose deacetylase